MSKTKITNDWHKVWEMWNQVDMQDAMLKNCACDVGFNGNKKDKEQFRKTLWLLKTKYEQNIKLIDSILSCIDKN
jgi:hypothetical protein